MKKNYSTVALALAAAAVVILIVLGAFLGHAVKKAIEIYGQQITQTTVTVDSVHLSLLTGSARVKGLAVYDPKNYTMPKAIDVGTIAVGVDPLTVFSDKVVIHSMRFESPEIAFEGGLAGNNLSQLLDNANSTDNGNGTLLTTTAAQPRPVKKYEVDDLTITGAKVQVTLTTMAEKQVVSLPEIHLTDLGKEGEGITATDLARTVLAAISSTTVETVAKAAADFDKNAATLKRAGGNTSKPAASPTNDSINK